MALIKGLLTWYLHILHPFRQILCSIALEHLPQVEVRIDLHRAPLELRSIIDNLLLLWPFRLLHPILLLLGTPYPLLLIDRHSLFIFLIHLVLRGWIKESRCRSLLLILLLIFLLLHHLIKVGLKDLLLAHQVLHHSLSFLLLLQSLLLITIIVNLLLILILKFVHGILTLY